CDKIAIRVFGWRCRKRKTSSSINVVLPATPGPVMPMTFDGRCLVRAGLASFDGWYLLPLEAASSSSVNFRASTRSGFDFMLRFSPLLYCFFTFYFIAL